MFEIIEQEQVPEKCDGCGEQCELVSEVNILKLMKLSHDAIGEKFVGESGEEIDRQIDEHLSPEQADELKKQIRMGIGNSIENLDEQLETAQQEIAANALACSGVLRMRASKNGITYTVNVCTSARAHVLNRERPTHMTLHVNARSTDA